MWIRFYKSFNYDSELKARPDAVLQQRLMTTDGWRPHVCVPLEHDITAVVGAPLQPGAIRVQLNGEILSDLALIPCLRRLMPDLPV
ncbi:hypothetical protein ACSMXN_24115 [Jatrophihabitans sp. DSM 45814]